MNIVLAHGILDLSRFVIGLPFAAAPEYFRGVRGLLEARGHHVLVGRVPILGSLDERSTQLAQQIADRFSDGELHVISHSMGGLDMRRVLHRHADIARRTRVLVTIGTPHYGAALATRLEAGAVPLSGLFPSKLGAPMDLVMREELQDPDVEGVDYFDIACDASLAPASVLFQASALFSGFAAGTQHDGVVGTRSAQARDAVGHTKLPVWPVDHGGATGWERLPLSALQAYGPAPAAHLARYAALAEMLEQRYGR
jgi:pimeloyl-ACP methyl ester carboxylesterase